MVDLELFDSKVSAKLLKSLTVGVEVKSFERKRGEKKAALRGVVVLSFGEKVWRLGGELLLVSGTIDAWMACLSLGNRRGA